MRAELKKGVRYKQDVRILLQGYGGRQSTKPNICAALASLFLGVHCVKSTGSLESASMVTVPQYMLLKCQPPSAGNLLHNILWCQRWYSPSA